jgi:hypothetical protein
MGEPPVSSVLNRIDHRRQCPVRRLAAHAILGAIASVTLAVKEARPQEPSPKSSRSPAVVGGATKSFTPSDRYEVRQIEGWPVHVNQRFLARQPKLAKETLALLREKLRQIERRLPAAAVKKLRTIQFWVEENEPHHPCMTYHPDPAWLREHGMNPDKARCVELSNARNFLKWSDDQPWMVLHELSHGYHHQFLERGFENIEVKTAFDNAIKSKRYESVRRNNGKTEKAYAATNPMEYFAEATEAYFGVNDFYPANRAELKQHDSEIFALLGTLWADG